MSSDAPSLRSLPVAAVIPTLNAAKGLAKTLASLPPVQDIIIADGGSQDATLEITQRHDARIIQTDKGRGRQLRAGARDARTDWLLFLHADTVLDERAGTAIAAFVANPENAERAGYFRFTLDSDHERAKRLEQKVRWRCRTFALPYGDQGFLISADFYNALGGYRDMPLMEDVDLVWRIEKARGKQALVELSADAVTSASKFERDGYLKRSARNLFCLFLFWIKVPPRLIAKVY